MTSLFIAEETGALSSGDNSWGRCLWFKVILGFGCEFPIVKERQTKWEERQASAREGGRDALQPEPVTRCATGSSAIHHPRELLFEGRRCPVPLHPDVVHRSAKSWTLHFSLSPSYRRRSSPLFASVFDEQGRRSVWVPRQDVLVQYVTASLPLLAQDQQSSRSKF